MKQSTIFLTLILLIVLALPSHAQTEKGNFLIGGTGLITSTSSKDNNSSSSSASLNPTVSYFFIDRLAAGLIMNLGTSKSSNTDGVTITNRTTNFAIGPTVRYYFPLDPKIALFPEIDWTFGKVTNKYSVGNNSTTSSYNTSSIKAGVGAAYFIAKNVGLEGFVYYQSNTNDGQTDDGSVNFRLGLQVYINKH